MLCGEQTRGGPGLFLDVGIVRAWGRRETVVGRGLPCPPRFGVDTDRMLALVPAPRADAGHGGGPPDGSSARKGLGLGRTNVARRERLVDAG